MSPEADTTPRIKRALRFSPLTGGGKYHAINPIVTTAHCGAGLLDTTVTPIHTEVGADPRKAHPIMCRRCLKAATR